MTEQVFELLGCTKPSVCQGLIQMRRILCFWSDSRLPSAPNDLGLGGLGRLGPSQHISLRSFPSADSADRSFGVSEIPRTTGSPRTWEIWSQPKAPCAGAVAAVAQSTFRHVKVDPCGSHDRMLAGILNSFGMPMAIYKEPSKGRKTLDQSFHFDSIFVIGFNMKIYPWHSRARGCNMSFGLVRIVDCDFSPLGSSRIMVDMMWAPHYSE